MTKPRLPNAVTDCVNRRASKIVLARVSDASRAELIAHVDTALVPHLHDEHLRATYQLLMSDPLLLERGTPGREARAALGWRTLFFGGAEIGIRAQVEDRVVLLLNASATKRTDVGNPFVSVMTEELAVLEAAQIDPHLPASQRPHVFVPYADRLVRDEELGWVLYRAGQRARVVFTIAGHDIDTCASDGRTAWTMYAWQGAGSRDTTVTRLTDGELNLYRAGLHGGPEHSLLRGFRWEQTPMPDGTWRRAVDVSEASTIPHHVEPDPESWWEVETVLTAASDPQITTWRALATRLGEGGITSRGMDEKGTPLHQLQDPVSAAKLLLGPDKLVAYRDGRWPHTRRGAVDGQWTTPSGHQFQPDPLRVGDTRGTITYDVELPAPTWPTRFRAGDIDAIMRKWWPEGKIRRGPTTRRASDEPRRPLASVVAWQDDHHRYEVMAHSGRYELRQQALRDAPRNADGTTSDLRHEASDLVASWPEAELTGIVADVLDTAIQRALTQAPTAEFAEMRILNARPGAEPRPDNPEVAGLRRRIAEKTKTASGKQSLAELLVESGRKSEALEAFDEAQSLRGEIKRLTEDLAACSAPTPPVEPEPSVVLDVATPAAVVAALRGPFGAGAQPVQLNRAVCSMLTTPGSLRLQRIPGDSLHVRVEAAIALRLSDGTTLIEQVEKEVPARLPDSGSNGRDAIVRLVMRDGRSVEDVAAAARMTPTTVRRKILDALGEGPRVHRQRIRAGEPADARQLVPGLRAAALAAPPAVRQGIWACLSNASSADHPKTRYLALLDATYLRGDPDTRWGAGWSLTVRDRYRAVVVLTSTPALRLAGMDVDDLAACLGVPRRAVEAMARPATVNRRRLPATLTRMSALGARGGARVTVPRCSHVRGGGLCTGFVDALIPVPEVLHSGATSLCSTCRRPPGSRQPLPDSYLDEAAARAAQHQGRWQPCSAVGCQLDIGGGPGMAWRWDDDEQLAQHTSIQHGRATTVIREVRRCALPGCDVDEGAGPGLLIVAGRGSRRWHAQDCNRAAQKLGRAAAHEPTPCGYEHCTVDDGAGPGMISPTAAGRQRRWHSRACKAAQRRVEEAVPPAGTEIWVRCGDPGCGIDEGRGAGSLRLIAGAPGRPRRHHTAACARARRRRESVAA